MEDEDDLYSLPIDLEYTMTRSDFDWFKSCLCALDATIDDTPDLSLKTRLQGILDQFLVIYYQAIDAQKPPIEPEPESTEPGPEPDLDNIPF